MEQSTPGQPNFSHNEAVVNKQPFFLIFPLAILIIILGVATGYLLSGSQGLSIKKTQTAPGATVKDKIVGIEDEKTYRDTAEGKLEKGGVDGEGTHHLIRDGGPNQNVYLTSSVINLNDFVGKKVKVWGETFKAQKAGWFMDVGRIRIAE